tara:strand:- start:238 stop:888 length:651 start_codon:yes stop_codon:yes gene_type:complete
MTDSQTAVMFGIPLGMVNVSKEICNQLKPLRGITQFYQKPPKSKREYEERLKDFNFNLLGDHPKLKQDITDVFSNWVNESYNFPNQRWTMTTSWITNNPEGAPMARHRHFNCAFTGVLYFDKVHESYSQLELENPISPSDFFPAQQGNTFSVFNAPSFIAPLHEGLMLLFPSNIFHSHPAFKKVKKSPRRSFACNFVPIGKYGNSDSTLDTNWLSA